MKKFLSIILVLLLCVSFVGCDSNKENMNFAESVYDARVKYATDESKVINLIEVMHLSFQTAFCTVDFQCDEKPYSITLKYSEHITDAKVFEGRVKQYACVLLASVKNLSAINWNYDVSGKKYSGSLTVEDATKMVGKDIKSFYSSYEEFLGLLVDLEIAEKNGNEKAGPSQVITITGNSSSK